MAKGFEYYIKCFSELRRNKEKGGAPHKPILLLSIIDAISKGLVSSNRIYVTPELIAIFRHIWNSLPIQEGHLAKFATPFFHMRTEPFWMLVPNKGRETILQRYSSITDFSSLAKNVSHAIIDEELYQILLNKTNREILTSHILSTYFNGTTDNFTGYSTDSVIISALQENAVDYNFTDKVIEQESSYCRCDLFKKEIPRIYNFTCAISGLRVTYMESTVSMVDACHIVPFSESHDDSIKNGIALSPNLHRAFDRGLISISDEYTVLVSKSLIEDKNSAYNLSQFKGKRIHLPYDESLYPSLENIAYHRQKFRF